MMARILRFLLNIFMIHQIFSVNHPVDGYQIDTSDIIHRICSEEKLMLRRGLPWPIVSKMIDDKIMELATIEPKRLSSQKGIQLERNTQVGEYGQSIKSNVLGVEQATMSSSGAAQLDESNNYADESEINRLKFSNRPSVSLGKRVDSSNMVRKTSMELSGCEKKVLKLVEEAILSENSGHYMLNDLRKGHDLGMGEGSFGGTIDSRASSPEYPTITSIADETSISPHGYNFDLAQTASGNSQNSFSGSSDQQNHSTYRKSKISQISLSISPGVNI